MSHVDIKGPGHISSDPKLPLYECHKRVRALAIKHLVSNSDGSYTVYFKDSRFSCKRFEAKLFARYVPVPGDYYVVYQDGYESWSPKKEFEEGYDLLLGASHL